MIELPPREQYFIRSGTLGSSGIWLKWLSSAFLNTPMEQLVMFRTCIGRELNVLGPLIAKLANRMFLMRFGAALFSLGILQ